MKWIRIDKLPPREDRKTDAFEVWSIYENTSLGIIKWKANWRKYAFFPYVQTCFEQTCMRDIADFIEKETKQYKKTNWVRG